MGRRKTTVGWLVVFSQQTDVVFFFSSTHTSNLRAHCVRTYIYSPFFLRLPPYYYCSLVGQTRGHIRSRPFSPPPTFRTARPWHSYLKKVSARSSLLDLRRTALTHAGRSAQLVSRSLYIHIYMHIYNMYVYSVRRIDSAISTLAIIVVLIVALEAIYEL